MLAPTIAINSLKTGSTEAGEAEPKTIAIPSTKKGFRWKRTRHSHRGKQDPEQKQLKQADLDTLKVAAQEGYIELKYLDESGCCMWSPVSYSYSRSGEQKRQEQPERRGRRISILGLWQPDEGVNMHWLVAVSTVPATSR